MPAEQVNDPSGMAADERLRVVIVGGGTAGWMTAAALAHRLPRRCTVRLIESAEIGMVGVGEATLSHLRDFNRQIGIAEPAFMAATAATHKLGIEFRDWGRIGDRYMHPFGTFGRAVDGVGFLHYWRRARENGRTDRLDDYSLPIVAARLGRYAPGDVVTGVRGQRYDSAYHLDATRYAPFLRSHAERAGVVRIEGRVAEVLRGSESGDITSLVLASGEVVAGDLFVDCSGFRSLLLGEAFGAAWEDWSAWLPCDRAVAVPCSGTGPLLPYTQAIAMPAGWRWRIPLQHRIGNGYVYSSAHLSNDEAAAALLGAIEGEALAEPRQLRFKAGRRARSCIGNCVGVGLASGFLEPLESTSIYLIQVAIQTLLELFPTSRAGFSPVDRAAFNRLIDAEYDRIRDFLILHYHATERSDSAFWNQVRTMPIPESLTEKIALFRARGRLEARSTGLFLDASWIALLIGQGIVPVAYDQRADAIPLPALTDALDRLRAEFAAAAEAMPDHRAALAMQGAAVAA